MMMRGLLWLGLMATATTAACSPGNRGVLDPLEGVGVERVSTHGQPNDTARLRLDGVTADVTGRWSDVGESIEVAYQAGPQPARIAITAASEWQGQPAPATDAWDRSTTEPGSPIGRRLLETGRLDVPAGERRLVQIQFDRADGAGRPTIGDEVTVSVPMPGGARRVRFRVSGE